MIKLYAPKLFYCQNPLFSPDKNNGTEIKSLFEKAVAETHSMLVEPGSEILLHLYSLYKQATEGDVDMTSPTDCFDNIAKAKYDAWASLKGKSSKDAQREYIMLVHQLKA